QIVDLSPASVEQTAGAYLVTDDHDRAHEFVKRCEETDLDPREIPVRDLHQLEPVLQGNGVCAVFKTNDTSFSPNVVLHELVARALVASVEIRCESRIVDFVTVGDAITSVIVRDGRGL